MLLEQLDTGGCGWLAALAWNHRAADNLRVLLTIVLVDLLLHADIVTDRNVAVAKEDFDAALLQSVRKISCLLCIK